MLNVLFSLFIPLLSCNAHTIGAPSSLSMQRSLNKDQQTNGVNGHAQTNGSAQHYDLDAVIIGGGFAGVYLLYLLRKEGFNAKIVEAGTGLGGIWWWNNYPGARVDSQYPVRFNLLCLLLKLIDDMYRYTPSQSPKW